MDIPKATHAVVRDVPDSFDRAIQPFGPAGVVDVDLAKQQHRVYCESLEASGLELVRVDADERYPDCCYVEDTAVIAGDKAIIAEMAAESRRGETAAIEAALNPLKEVHRVTPPATLDGGDVLVIGRRVFVGLSTRTNGHAVDQLRAVLAGDGFEVTAVPVRQGLHLKTACTHVAGDFVLYLPGHLEGKALAAFTEIIVPEAEAHAANCVSANGRVLIPTEAPWTAARISELGLETVELDISESLKAAGRLTCSSIVF
jgi:dimethylargininase